MIVCRMPGSLRLGDALERYGESRRLAKSNGCRFEGWAAEEPGTQRLWVKRRSARLEERHGHNGCKVDDASISPQGMPSRTLVAHRPNSHDPSADDDLLRRNRSHQWQMLGSSGRCATSEWADNHVAACNGTLWLARQRIQVSAARHGSVARSIRNSLGSFGL